MFAHVSLHEFPIHVLHIRMVGRPQILFDGDTGGCRHAVKCTPSEWKDAYTAGIFTEFMEQRAPGHTVLGDVIYRKGLLDLQADIDAALERLDWNGDPRAWDKQQELQAMRI